MSDLGNMLTSGELFSSRELLSATVDSITSRCPGCEKNVTIRRGDIGEDVFEHCSCGYVLFARWVRSGIHTTWAESLASAKKLIEAFFDTAERIQEALDGETV